MKSTYKLLGAFWDKMPCEKENPIILETNPVENTHYILLSQLLSARSIDAVERLLLQNDQNPSVTIVVDFVPKFDNKTLNVFLDKRISQVSEYLKRHFTKVNFVKTNNVS